MAAINKTWPRIRLAKNGAGKESWVVDCRPHGKKQYYPSKREAEAAAHIARVQQKHGDVLASQVFSKGQMLDAQVAFGLLDGTNITLTETVREYLDRRQKFGKQRTIALAGRLYLQSKQGREARTIKEARAKVNRFRRDFVKRKIGDIKTAEVSAWLKVHEHPITYDNYRGAISTMFNWFILQEWLDRNPVKFIPKKSYKPNRPAILTVD